MERLRTISKQTTSGAIKTLQYPLDPLDPQELSATVSLVKKKFGKGIAFNTVTLQEPKKAELLAWEESPSSTPKPDREAYFVIFQEGVEGIIEGTVNISKGKVGYHTNTKGVQPILTLDELVGCDDILRKDPTVIEQCILSGVPENEMDHVFADPWALGFDERWPTERRLQQAILYYRSDEDDSHYSHPLDFCPIIDVVGKKVIFIDIPPVRRPLSKHPHSNFNPPDIEKTFGYRNDNKPINVTQPEGVSFNMTGRIMEWSNWKFHIGFNYREGIVLSNISYNDHGSVRPLFYRLSIAEMVVPYGNPEHPHYRKHAFDLGEYGAGYLSNSLTVGCDCKGVIHYLDFHYVDKDGEPTTVKNTVCIHEEDNGILFKHSDFRDDFKTSIVTRATKLIVSQIFTASNYEYMIYWIFHQDGTIQLEIKLTGILNTYVMNEDEDAGPWGTQVYPQVNAHNHQHLFSLRIHPRIDGDGNSLAVADAQRSYDPVGHPNNKYGNGFFAGRTVFKTVADSITDYDGTTSRTWDFINPNKLNAYSGKPVSYKLVSRECAHLMAKPGAVVWNRAPFARHHFQAVPYKDGEIYPAGDHVVETKGNEPVGLDKWIGDGKASIENTDVVAYHTFGITHFPAPEDFPVMPAEPMTLLLRPRHFFLQNPGLDIKPSHALTTSQARKRQNVPIKSLTDSTSRLAFVGTNSTATGGSCCSKK